MDQTTLTLIVYLVATFGLAYVLGHSKITQRIRELAFDFSIANGRFFPLRWPVLLIECPACLGFWVGVAFGWRLFHLASNAIVLGFFTCSTNFMLGRWTGLISNPRDEPARE